jgi:diguanylate cyclase (GGDEF)-like protein/PAS domain S-box-containing protein
MPNSAIFPMLISTIKQDAGQETDTWYRAFFGPKVPPMYVYDAATLDLLEVNDAAMQLYGYSRQEFLNLNLKDVCPGGMAPGPAPVPPLETRDAFQWAGIWRHLGKDHRTILTDAIKHMICYQGKEAVLVIASDVTERMRVANRIEQSADDLIATQAIAHVGSWTWKPGGTEMSWSAEAFRIYGYQPNSITPDFQIFTSQIHSDDRAKVIQAINDAVAGIRPYNDLHRIILPNGALRTVDERGEVRKAESGQPDTMIGTVQDVTDLRQAEQEIYRIAYFDEITGLPNRRKLRIELEQALQAAHQQHRHLVLFIIQLERLREINLTLGHENGDSLLRQIRPRLVEVLPAGSVIARFGDAQFAAILHGTSAFSAAHMAEHVVDALNRPFDIAGIAFTPGAHIGAALFPAHAADADTLIQRANVAAILAGQSGKDYLIYSPDRDPYKPQRLSMLGEFRHAVESGQLLLYCQPKADLRTGRIVGAESLVRWQHPQYGLVSPSSFIPLIEPTELIEPLTEWMLESAISQCFKWRQAGIDLPLAVNLSARNLHEHNLPDLLRELLETWGADTSWIDLEITESGIMADPAVGHRVLDQLHRNGFRLFIDDYGTGYSSLAYLMRLPVDFIKIDQSFVMPMLQDRPAAAIVRSSIDLAHRLDMRVVAEGTATREVWDALKTVGCDQAQGYFIAAPIPADQFADWLGQHKAIE